MGQGVSAIFDSSGFFDKNKRRREDEKDELLGEYAKLENEIH